MIVVIVIVMVIVIMKVSQIGLIVLQFDRHGPSQSASDGTRITAIAILCQFHKIVPNLAVQPTHLTAQYDGVTCSRSETNAVWLLLLLNTSCKCCGC